MFGLVSPQGRSRQYQQNIYQILLAVYLTPKEKYEHVSVYRVLDGHLTKSCSSYRGVSMLTFDLVLNFGTPTELVEVAVSMSKYYQVLVLQVQRSMWIHYSYIHLR